MRMLNLSDGETMTVVQLELEYILIIMIGRTLLG